MPPHSHSRLSRTPHVVWVVMVASLAGVAGAATSSNARSAMGINLASVNYFMSEQPFLNCFLTSEAWITHSDTVWDTNEEKFIKLDPDGWPMTLDSVNETGAQRFNSLGVVFLLGMPATANGNYPAGDYIVLYDGQGTLSYGADAALVRRAPGRDVIKVSPSNKGIDLRITATDPHHAGNYLHNIRVVTAANEAAIKAGGVFNPEFLKVIQNFRTLRFMDWFEINGSSLSAWSDRPRLGGAFYGTSKGVPVEIAVSLANQVSADAWMNVPIMADDDYIKQMATLVRRQLGSSQKIYVELSNEVWNFSFSQSKYAVKRGQALWPGRPSGRDGYAYNREWYGTRTAQLCDIWRSVWGADPRFVCVLAAQAAWSASATESLDCPYWTQGAPCYRHGINVVAIAPYLGGALPSAWTKDADGGLSRLFQSLLQQNDPLVPAGGFLAQEHAWIKDFVAKLTPYRLPLVAYEGGQTFANGATEALDNLYMTANRDPRMRLAYEKYLQQWKADGGQLFMHYNDIGVGSKYGSWGALESIMQTITPLGSAPPKWQAIQDFLTNNPCWWAACNGAFAERSP